MRDRFAGAGLGTPALDARLLAQAAFGRDGARLAADEHEPAPKGQMRDLESFARRRLAGEPVARILGEKEFYGLVFGLNAATLVPRPETELLVDLGVEFLEGRRNARILDLGTGSGCIIISLLAHLPDARGVAVDLSEEALAQAAANAARHDVSERIDFRQGSWFAGVRAGEKFDLIVSNPPYIESGTIAGLEREVRLYDPMLALDGGPDGLAPYTIIAGHAGALLDAGGAVIVEVGAGQADAVCALLQQGGLEKCTLHHDLAGTARAVFAFN